MPTCVSGVAATGDGGSGLEDEQCGDKLLCKKRLQEGTLRLAVAGRLNMDRLQVMPDTEACDVDNTPREVMAFA